MRNSTKRLCSLLLAVLMLLPCTALHASADYETVFVLTVVGVDGFGGGDVEAGTDLSLVLPAEPKKDGYSFTGWVVTNGAGEVIEQPSVMPSYDVTFTAQWESAAARYSITFLADDGSVIATHDYLEGETIELPDYPPEGWKLLAWRNTENGRVETVPMVMPAQDLEYVAVIEEAYYTITFMEGTTEVGEITGYDGEQAEIITRPPVEGMEFVGWSLSPDAVTADYVPGDILDLSGDMTLYAVWTESLPAITLRYPTLEFEDVIRINVYFEVTKPEQISQMGLITYASQVEQWNVDNAQAVIPGYGYKESAGLYYVTSEGIPAKCLGDTLWFAVYVQLTDGSYLYSKLVSYSPKTYAYAQLSTDNPDLQSLMVAMLNYGTAAQEFFTYNTDTPVNSSLTAEQLALVEAYRADMMDAVVAADSTKVGIFTNSGGFTRKYPTVSFEGAFCVNYYLEPSNTPDGSVKLYYWTQADYNAAETLTAGNATGCLIMTADDSGVYHAVVEGIAAKDLDKTVYVAGGYLSGGTACCTGVLAYSIGAYCTTSAASGEAVSPLAQATAVYGYYAKQMFYQAV